MSARWVGGLCALVVTACGGNGGGAVDALVADSPAVDACIPACSNGCGDDGCGGQCCEQCFSGNQSTNLYAVSAMQGPTPGGITCNLPGALTMDDDQFAGVAYGGTDTVTIDGKEVNSCIVVDLGKGCLTGTAVGIAYQMRYAADVCGDTGGTQCNLPGLCGSLSGINAQLFAGPDLAHLRFFNEVGNCGSPPPVIGGEVRGAHPYSGAQLDAIRYIMACRPAASCDASAANLEVDALYLIYRP